MLITGIFPHLTSIIRGQLNTVKEKIKLSMLDYVCVFWFILLMTVIEHNCVYDQIRFFLLLLLYFSLQI